MFPPPTIVAVGEALWDVFGDRRRPGGAPCNVAYHAARLGNRAVMVTRLGRDAAGDDLAGFLARQGVDTAHVQRDDAHPTGTVAVTMHDGQPVYTITADVAWDYLASDPSVRSVARTAAAVCVGSLAQRHAVSRAAIGDLLAAAQGKAMVVFDVNLRPPFVDRVVMLSTLTAADVVKMGEDEIEPLSALLGRRNMVSWLLDEVGVQIVCVTHGGRGASLTTAAGSVSVPGVEIDAAEGDPVGAGDAFTAALTHQLIRGAGPETALDTANRYAALVASRPGAMPHIPPAAIRDILDAAPER